MKKMKKLILGLSLLMSVFGFGQVPHTVTFLGNSSDFNAAEQVLGGDNVEYYVTYDDTYIYIGAFRVSGNTWDNFDHFTIYFDTDPKSGVSTGGNGSTTGVDCDGNIPNLPFQADYRAAIRRDNSGESFFNTYSDSWSTGVANAQGWTQFADPDALEVRIPWSDLGNPDGLYFLMYCSFSSGGGGFFGTSDSSYPINISGGTISGYFGGIGTKGDDYSPVNVRNQPIIDVLETSTDNLSNSFPYAKVTSNSNETATSNFTLASGGVLEMASDVLTISGSDTAIFQDGAELDGSGTGTFASGSSLQFDANGIIEGTITIPNVTISGGVDFGTNSTIDGSLTIESGGFVNTNSPIYGNNSTLIYNSANPTDSPYERRSEWSNAGNQGSPYNVILQNNTALDMGADNTTDDAEINGDLTIESGSSLFMDFDLNDMEAPLIVKGNFTNNGTITLSNEINGDLKLEGDLTDNGTFDYNNRALFFEGDAVQNITTSNDPNPYKIDVLRINKSAGEVIMNQDLVIDETGDPLQLSDHSILNLNGNELTIGQSSIGSAISFSANSALKVSENANLTLRGNGTMGNIRFDQTNNRTTNKIGNLIIEREIGDVSLGNSLYLNNLVTLNSGTLKTNGNLTFVSDENTTAQVAKIPNNGGNITGGVTVERYVPKSNRAFRYISSPVNTSGTINDNLQEGATTASNDPNPVPEHGTHITGLGSTSNGFDDTSTDNFSMFEWNETNQEWDEITSTNQAGDDMDVGDAYALMVRGDRSTTLNSNTAVGPATTLRFTGNLEVGEVDASADLSGNADDFNLVANPYQAIVDMKALLESGDATNLNEQFIYVYDPTLGTQGGYAAIELSLADPTLTPDNSDLTGNTSANENILPNQAFFVETTGNNPALTFKETYKNTGANFVDTFSDDEVLSEMHINLMRQPEDVLVDGVTARFDPVHSNAVNNADADEVWNFDEWVALYNTNTYISIEKRATPQENDTLQIYTGNYQSDDYVWNIDVSNINREAVLVDAYLDLETSLNSNDETNIAFTIDSNIPASSDPFRFSVRFTEETLSTDDIENSNLSIYPNPVTKDQFTINGSHHNGKTSVKLFDMTGKTVLSTTKSAGNTITIDINRPLPTGVYQLQISQDKSQYQSLLIISE
jgi:hypothetical protein